MDRRAITRVQAIILAIIVIAIACAAVFYYISVATPPARPLKEVKVGLIASITGDFAAAGGLAMYRGMEIAVEMVNDRGGVEGYRIIPVVADDQSSPDVGVREVERLITVEGVVCVNGIFSSAIALPVAGTCEKHKVPFFDVVAISDAITAKNYSYTFRIQPRGSAWGESTVEFMANKGYKYLGYDSPTKLKVAVIHEDGPYGVSVQDKNIWAIKKHGMQLIHHEAYSSKATDLSSLILKLKAVGPDVIFHTGYFSDIVLFLRQAKELGLKTYVYIGHGAGHANPRLLAQSVGADLVDGLFNVDPAPCQLLPKEKLGTDPYFKVSVASLIDEFLDRYYKKWGEKDPPTHATQGFAHTWVLITDIFARAVKKYGEITPETIRLAAIETDIPEGCTPAGYGVKFAPLGSVDKWGVPWGGQNMRSYPVVYQYIKDKYVIVWPEAMAVGEPVIPLPPNNPLSRR